MRFGAILALVQGWSTKVENMHFYQLSWNWSFKVDLDTHLSDKYEHLFLWYLELFWPLFNVCETKVENMHYCWLSWNWVLKVYVGTHLRDKWPIFMRFGAILSLVQRYSNQGWKYAPLLNFSELCFESRFRYPFGI